MVFEVNMNGVVQDQHFAHNITVVPQCHDSHKFKMSTYLVNISFKL